jgi:hypothetical protein
MGPGPPFVLNTNPYWTNNGSWATIRGSTPMPTGPAMGPGPPFAALHQCLLDQRWVLGHHSSSTPVPTGPAMGAPGLDSETWDPPSKGQSHPFVMFRGNPTLSTNGISHDVKGYRACVRTIHCKLVPQGRLNLAQDAVLGIDSRNEKSRRDDWKLPGNLEVFRD